MQVAIQGFLLGLSLIVAIGSQNAFLLRQGLLGKHVFALSLFCALSDALLIMVGVSGFYIVVQQFPVIIQFARFGGGAFIAIYGLLRFYSAYKGNSFLDAESATVSQTLKSAILSCTAFTFLNPHVYLDTVILLGSISAQYGYQAWLFGLGAVLASFSFFFSLGFGARLLRPIFSKPIAWQILDVLIGIVMLFIATNLIFFVEIG